VIHNFIVGLAAALVFPMPTFLAGFPELAAKMIKSRLAPWIFSIAAGIGCLGFVSVVASGITYRPIAIASWVPLYQLSLYSGALALFVRLRHSLPKNIVLNFNPGRAGDRLFAFLYLMAAVLPPAYALKP